MWLAVKGSMDLIAICESVYGNIVGRNSNTDNSKIMSGVDNLHLLGHEQHLCCGRT